MTSANPFAAAGRQRLSRRSCLVMAPAVASPKMRSLPVRSSIAPYYVGDQWRVTPKLTLNYGLRFEQMGPWSERYDRLSVLAAAVFRTTSARRPGIGVTGKLGLVNSPDSPSRNNQKLGNLFSPRLGIAYRLNEQDSIPRRLWDLLSAERCALESGAQ